MVVYFCLSLIFYIRYYYIRNLRAMDKLCLLINIMFIIMFIIKVIFATIKRGSGKMKIKIYFILKWNFFLTNYSNGNLLTFWSNENLLTFWLNWFNRHVGNHFCRIFIPPSHIGSFINGDRWKLTNEWICRTFSLSGTKIWILIF